MGAQRRQRGKPQHTGPHLRFSGCAGRCFVRLSLLPFCQTASAFRLICLFHTFCRRGVYRAMVFAPLRCPNLFRFPFACLRQRRQARNTAGLCGEVQPSAERTTPVRVYKCALVAKGIIRLPPPRRVFSNTPVLPYSLQCDTESPCLRPLSWFSAPARCFP